MPIDIQNPGGSETDLRAALRDLTYGFENDLATTGDSTTAGGITFGLKAGKFRGTSGQVYVVASGTAELLDFTDNQYVCLVTDDVVHMGEYFVTTNADNGGLALFKVSTDSGAITATVDLRTAFSAPPAGPVVVSITSGSDPVALTAPLVDTQYAITTGGTKGAESVTLAAYGDLDASRVGRKVLFLIYHFGSPSDIPSLTVNAGGGASFGLEMRHGNNNSLYEFICDGQNWKQFDLNNLDNISIKRQEGSLFVGNNAADTGKQCSGTDNLGVGDSVLSNITTGDNNCAFGAGAGQAVTIADDNTLFGFNANVGDDTITNGVAFGHGATVTESNSVQLGNSSVTKAKVGSAVVALETSITHTFTTVEGTFQITNGRITGFAPA